MPTRTTTALLILAVLISTPPVAVDGAASSIAGGDDATNVAAPDATDCSFPLTATDATGTTVELDESPERVVTLNPSAAQTMWEIGAREKVVGRTKYAAYLDGADAVENVSGPTDIVVVERVVALSPDLVLAPNATPSATVDQLRSAGLTVYRFPEAETIDDVHAKTSTIGRLVGECEAAHETVAWMRDRVEVAGEAAEGERRPDVLYAFFGYTAGRGTFVHEVIEAAGGDNVAAEYGVTGYRQLNPEVVVEADPDWIVRNSNDPVLPAGAPFNSTTAVREGQVVVVPIEHLNQPAPRIALGIAALAETFHPEAYAAANATVTPTATETSDGIGAEPTRTPATTTVPTEGTEMPGQPGFGIPAVLAVLLVLLATRGRG